MEVEIFLYLFSQSCDLNGGVYPVNHFLIFLDFGRQNSPKGEIFA